MSDNLESMKPEQPLRILHIITRMILGGAQENTFYTVVGQQKNPGVRVTLLTGVDGGPEGDLHDKALEAHVDLVIDPWLIREIRPHKDLVALWRLTRFIKRGKFDVVHTHSSKAGILGRLAAKMAGTPVVIHTLHSLVYHDYQAAWKNWLYIRMKRVCAPLTDRFISVNEKTRVGAISAKIGEPEKHVTIFSGMDLSPFLTVRDRLTESEAKSRLGIPADALVVGKIARLFPLKGHREFFLAADKIAKANKDAWFLLVGNGALLEELRTEAKRIGIHDRTVFAGLVPPDRVADCIQAMDVVVHTSLREGIARVLPQAGAVGKPVVVFDLDGASEVIRDGVSGYLVPPVDTDKIAQRVLELFRAPNLRKQFGEAGRQFARDHFSAELMVEKIERVYSSALGNDGVQMPQERDGGHQRSAILPP